MLSSSPTSTRRQALKSAACGFGYLALAGLCNEDAQAARTNPLAAKTPHHLPRAKRVIFIFMQGGPSHVDTYDPKPLLDKDDGKPVEFLVARTRKVTPEKLLKSPWKFK